MDRHQVPEGCDLEAGGWFGTWFVEELRWRYREHGEREARRLVLLAFVQFAEVYIFLPVTSVFETHSCASNSDMNERYVWVFGN